MKLRDIFNDTQTKVFKVVSDNESDDDLNSDIEPTDLEIIPEEEGFYYVKALQVFEDKVVPCYINMTMPERIAEFVVKQNENGITVVEKLYDQQNSVIPAVACEGYGDPELYYAKQNPMVGLEILKKGKLINPRSEAIIDDIAYIYEELGKNLNKKKIKTLKMR